MSEFTEKLIASIIKENNQGYLILKNSWSLFDSNIGFGGNTHSFNITIRSEKGQEIIAEESIKPEDISPSSQDKGFKIRLSTQSFNSVSSQVNRYSGKFETFVKEFTTADNKVVGPTREFFTLTEGDISLILESEEPQAQYVDSPVQSSLNSTASASSENLFSGVNQDTPVSQNVQPASSPKKKAFLIPLIAAIAALLLLLAAFLIWKGFFSGDDAVATQNPAVTEAQIIEEPMTEPVLEDESKKADDENKNAADDGKSSESSSSDENSQNAPAEAVNQEPQSPAENQAAAQSSAETPAVSANSTASSGSPSACTLSSEKDEVIISSCLSTNPKIEVISSLSEQSLNNDRCDLGKRLLSSYGRKDSSAAYMFAKYFDPNSTAQSKCIKKDKTQALYWYQKASDLGMNEANEAIGKLKE
ncbi:SEL1-like repeat protein [uncultured Succinivibrio sp.]|uniref:SEL1-like repeat protein n=1 Tax=uncultured Succinivibrio sp. TaxID=540749 RepID=UPI0025E616F3|nr:SEL1-like repeat protein [uncultured Succinivibrio sp.]